MVSAEFKFNMLQDDIYVHSDSVILTVTLTEVHLIGPNLVELNSWRPLLWALKGSDILHFEHFREIFEILKKVALFFYKLHHQIFNATTAFLVKYSIVE